MKVSVFSLSGVLFSGEADSVNVNTRMGQITLLPHHHPLISILKNGTLKISEKKGDDRYFDIAGGFLEVSNNKAVLLVDEK